MMKAPDFGPLRAACAVLWCAVMMRFSILAAIVAGVGCVPTSFDATLTDHAEALTTNGSDKLFDVEVTSADANIPLADVQLVFQPVGGTLTALNFALTIDSDGDGAVGDGDTLTGIEPGPDLLNGTHANQTFNVQLTEKTGPSTVVMHWEGTWNAQ